MLNKKVIIAIILFVVSGLVIFTFANQGDETSGKTGSDMKETNQLLIDATAAVKKAEKSQLQEDIDEAKKLVDALDASLDKAELNSRLGEITVLIVDITEPVITIGDYITTPTNQNIVVTATTDEGSLNATSHIFTRNGSFEFIATDAAGNVTSKTVTINNIDKVAPIITIGDYVKTTTNKDLTVTATTNEGTLNFTSITFSQNGSFKFIATDAAGNVTSKTVTINNIDKAVHVITINVNKTETSLFVGATETLVATVSPDNATYKTVTWTSSDETVATVVGGKVTAVTEGTTIITAKAEEKTATITVVVSKKGVVNVTRNLGYDTIAAAIAAALTADTLVLNEETNIDAAQVISGKNITINMNGFNIIGSDAVRWAAFKVTNGGDLTLDNTSGTLSKLVVGPSGGTTNYEGIRITAGGKATVKANVSIETGLPVFILGNGTAGSAQLEVYGILKVLDGTYAAIQGNGTVNYGGTLINIYPGAEIINNNSTALYIPQAGIVNVFGGTITGKDSAIGIKSGTLNISGGSLKATGGATIPTTGWSNGINASGCTVQMESNSAYSGNIIVNITGGTFESVNGYALYEYIGTGTETKVTSINVQNATLKSSNQENSWMFSEELNATPSKFTIGSGVVLINKD